MNLITSEIPLQIAGVGSGHEGSTGMTRGTSDANVPHWRQPPTGGSTNATCHFKAGKMDRYLDRTKLDLLIYMLIAPIDGPVTAISRDVKVSQIDSNQVRATSACSVKKQNRVI